MSQHPKKGIRWMIFNLIGPPELKSLVSHMDEISGAGFDIAMYPCGEFPFHVKTSMDDDVEPIVFPTPHERKAYHLGLQYGVSLMGGTTGALSEDDYDQLNAMSKKATHSGGSA